MEIECISEQLSADVKLHIFSYIMTKRPTNVAMMFYKPNDRVYKPLFGGFIFLVDAEEFSWTTIKHTRVIGDRYLSCEPGIGLVTPYHRTIRDIVSQYDIWLDEYFEKTKHLVEGSQSVKKKEWCILL